MLNGGLCLKAGMAQRLKRRFGQEIWPGRHRPLRGRSVGQPLQDKDQGVVNGTVCGGIYIYIYIYIYILITIKVSEMKKVTSQALYKRNIKIKEKKKKINESSDDL